MHPVMRPVMRPVIRSTLRLAPLALILLLSGPLAAAEAGAPAAGETPAADAATPGSTTQGPTGPSAGKIGLPPPPPPLVGTPQTPGRIGLQHYLVVSALVFGLGITIIVVRRNAIAVLMGIELLLNAAGLNFVAFSRYVGKDVVDGQVLTVFIIVIAAAEAAVALAIILNIYQNLNTVAVDEADALKG